MTLELPAGIADDFELSVRLDLGQDYAGDQHGFELFECFLGVRRQGAPFPLTHVGGQQVERGRQLGNVSDMSPEEIAQSEKGSHFGNVVWRLCGRHGLEFVSPWLDSFQGEFEAEVTDLCCAEE